MAKGLFTPRHPQKYMGDSGLIAYRSSWELRVMQKLDSHPAIIKWASEEIHIDYYHPFKKRIARYIPDFFVRYRDSRNVEHSELWEIKPLKEVAATKKSSTHDLLAIKVNEAKWAATVIWCKKANIKFRILTEKELFL